MSAYLSSDDNIKPIPEVIKDMTDDHRERLAASVAVVIEDLGVKDYEKLTEVLADNEGAREAIRKKVFEFLENEMKLEIVD